MVKMQRIRNYSIAGMLLVITILSLSLATSLALAQNTSGSFNPQNKFQIGTSFSITSIYGIATIRSLNQSNPHRQPHQMTQVDQQDSEVSTASMTITGQVVNDTRRGGVQWAIKSGTIAIKENTLTIIGGKGEIDSFDRLVITGTATDSNARSFRWQLTGLATIYNGMVIAEMNGNSSTEPNHSGQRSNLFEDVDLTYMATIS